MKKLFNDNWTFCKIHLENSDSQINLQEIINSLFMDSQNKNKQQNINHSIKANLLNKNNFSPVEIPHDWLIYNTDDLYENSIGLYKKDFELSKEQFQKETRFFVRFEGVYMDSSIFVNGQKIFEWKYGYTTFEVDITPFVFEGTNTIYVCAVYRSPNSRWYSGAGIYRNVWLITTAKTHIVQDGISWATVKLNDNSYNLNIQTETIFHATTEHENETVEATVVHTLYEPENIANNLFCSKELAKTNAQISIKAVFTDDKPYFFVDNQEKFSKSSQTLNLKNIKEWSTEEPNLYLLKTELYSKNGAILDTSIIRIGFCTFLFDSDKGFFLNGKYQKIHGACMHHDLGALGSAFNKSAARRQLKKLKRMGVNAIRTSHNPYAPEFLDLADELGFLIDSECFDMWEKNKTTYDYANYFKEWHERDTAAWIRRDRNHVSVFMWSIGNEIYDTHQGNGLKISKKLVALVRKFDTLNKAPTTIASNYIAWEGAQRCMQEVDLAGYNYTERLYEEHHKTYPHWKIYGSETASTVQSRGIYHFPANFRTLTHDDGQCSSLGNCSTNWGAKNSAEAIILDRDATFCLGQFIWTGFDYIGEPTPYFTKNSYFGQIDTAGFEKDSFFAYQAEWTTPKQLPMVHLLPYWDFNENQLIDIRAYSNCAKTELFFNEKSLGTFVHNHQTGKTISGEWQLPYKKGTIKVKAYDENGICIAEDSQSSFGDSVQIIMKADNIEDFQLKEKFEASLAASTKELKETPDFSNINEPQLLFVSIFTNDKDGNFVANARNRIKISVKGGKLLGLDNGDSTDYEQYKTVARNLFSGRLVAIIEKTDDKKQPLIIDAVSAGLIGAKLSFENGKITSVPLSEQNYKVGKSEKNDEIIFIPARKIQLIASGSLSLTKENKSVEIEAKIFPPNATSQPLLWQAVRLEGIDSKCAEIEQKDNEHIVVHAKGDGIFRLRCSCKNNSNLPQVVSEYEMSVDGFGTTTLNPFNFISGCEASISLQKRVLSFQGGSFFAEGRNWIGFENVDFGKDGSDEITIPVFSFSDEVHINLWDGSPDSAEGKLLDSLTYNAKSIYNHYQPNTWKLSRRLFGIHTICFETNDKLSMKGFSFSKTPKAFSKLSSLDANCITGDMFKKTTDAIQNIGNNVSIEFSDMDFGTGGTNRIVLQGKAPFSANTIQLRFNSQNENPEEHIFVIEAEKCTEYKSFYFDFSKKITGLQKVTFIFLPGSNFDFKDFQFF